MIKQVALFFATVSYLGRMPKAPGTWGSIAGIGFVALIGNHFLIAMFSCILLYLVGIWCAPYAIKYFDSKDPSEYVLDEFIGVIIACFGVPISFLNLLLAFALFRFFDIVKPLGIERAQKIDNNNAILIDDVVAGIYANILVQVFLYLT